MILKKITVGFLLFYAISIVSQSKYSKTKTVNNIRKKTVSVNKKDASSIYPMINENIPLLIPKNKNGKFGFVNQKGSFVIPPVYNFAMFFGEDCNLLNASNEKLRKFGASHYATVEKNGVSFRINKLGKQVYQYKSEDLGSCKDVSLKSVFRAYILDGKYGVIEELKFKNPSDHTQFKIYPNYQYLYILEGEDVLNPMIVAVHNDKFGIIDVNNKIVIPFEYSDIKRNYSWKLGKMFEVTKDDENYYYIDTDNHFY